ncbi:MAG: DUF192 domain-containing protein [Dehalococcoidia bacterium]
MHTDTRSILARATALLAVCGLTFAAACSAAPASSPAGSSAATGSAASGATGTPGAAAGTAAGANATAEPVASTFGIATAALPKARFTTGTTTVTLPIEVPPEREYSIGLSGRRSLEGRGMLFAFPDGATVGFWMKGTHIDLDIAFVDASMRVIEVQTMRAETLDIHTPPGRYIAAVEAPAGWYAANNVKAGAQVAFDVDLKAATGR